MLWHLKAMKANYVQISSYGMQRGLNATTLYKETDRDALAHIFRVAREIGLGVFFKPVIELETWQGSYEWRGRIRGSHAWFRELYLPYMLSMATLAEEEGVEVLSLGSEYRAAVNKTREWVHVIKEVRKVFSGKLTYIGNHDSYWHVKFWRHLDLISISAYFRLISPDRTTIPDDHETMRLFEQRAKKLQKWRKSRNLQHLKVLVAEVGYQSKGGLINYYEPWAWTAEGERDTYSQMKMYEAFMAAFMTKPWSLGAMIWHYELDMNVGRSWAKEKYTPQNKPAQWVMKRYFKKYCHGGATDDGLEKPGRFKPHH